VPEQIPVASAKAFVCYLPNEVPAGEYWIRIVSQATDELVTQPSLPLNNLSSERLPLEVKVVAPQETETEQPRRTEHERFERIPSCEEEQTIELHRRCADGDCSAVQRFLKQDASLLNNKIGEHCALRVAMENGHEDIAALLLDHEADPFWSRAPSDSSQEWDLAMGDLLRDLDKAGSSEEQLETAGDLVRVSSRGSSGDQKAPVMHTSWDAGLPSLRVSTAGSPEDKLKSTTRKLFTAAAKLSRGSCIGRLLKLHPDSAKALLLGLDDEHSTLLHLAALRDQAEICRAIFSACVDEELRHKLLEAQTLNGHTAVQVAARNECDSALRVLIQFLPCKLLYEKFR